MEGKASVRPSVESSLPGTFLVVLLLPPDQHSNRPQTTQSEQPDTIESSKRQAKAQSFDNNVGSYLGKQYCTHLWGSCPSASIRSSRTGPFDWRLWVRGFEYPCTRTQFVWNSGSSSCYRRLRVLWIIVWCHNTTTNTSSAATSYSGSSGNAGKCELKLFVDALLSNLFVRNLTISIILQCNLFSF